MIKFNFMFFVYAQAFMLGMYFVHLKLKKADLADFGWVVLVFSSMFFSLIISSNFKLPNLLLALLVTIWSLKLGSRILIRLIQSKREDSRYAFYREKWGESSNLKFLVIFLLQAVFVLALSLPFVIANFYGAEVSIVGIFLCLIGMLGSYIADSQLKEFKKTALSNEICQKGLWSYSRHPNYFFEWITWCGYVFFLINSQYFLLSLFSPIVMYLLLVYGTGIPPLERVAVQNKGESYLNYQKTTSKFFLRAKK